MVECSISLFACRFGPLKEPKAKEFASMIFLGDTRGEGITMPLEMATVGELSVFTQGAGVVVREANLPLGPLDAAEVRNLLNAFGVLHARLLQKV